MERIHGPLVGPRRADLRAGQVVAAVVNSNRTKETDPVLEPDKAALKFTPPLSPEEEHEAARAAFGLG